MSTENTSSVQTVESLRAALSQAKFRQLQAESALLKARSAVVSAEVDIKVQAEVIARIAADIASLSTEDIGLPDQTGVYPSFDVFVDGVALGYVRFFGYDSSRPWSGFVWDGEKCENCETRAAAESWVRAQSSAKKVA